MRELAKPAATPGSNRRLKDHGARALACVCSRKRCWKSLPCARLMTHQRTLREARRDSYRVAHFRRGLPLEFTTFAFRSPSHIFELSDLCAPAVHLLHHAEGLVAEHRHDLLLAAPRLGKCLRRRVAMHGSVSGQTRLSSVRRTSPPLISRLQDQARGILEMARRPRLFEGRSPLAIPN